MSEPSEHEERATLDEEDRDALAARLRELVEIEDRRYGLPPRTYEKCFVGAEAVTAMVEAGIAGDRADALRIGNVLLEAGVFRHVLGEHAFEDRHLFYRFAVDEDRGRAATHPDGSRVSWADFLGPLTPGGRESLLADIPERDPALGSFAQVDLEAIGVAPLDEHNAKLLDAVHPKGWTDPEPAGRYNLVVIGAGTGGLVSSAVAAGLGGRAALVESHLMGGDCLNVGCVPSKALLRCAKVAATVREAERFGVRLRGQVEVDFPGVMARMRELRAHIAPHDSARRFADDVGVDVYIGRARFTGPDTVEVNGKSLQFAKAVVATGGTAAVPPIPGLAEAPYLTNASVFNLTELPPRLGVIGAGPIGMELAQAFRRFGSEVTVLARGVEVMPREDREAAALVEKSMREEGVRFELGVEFGEVVHAGGAPPVTVVVERGGEEIRVEVDALLVATGRKPNVGGLGLEEAGVEYDEGTGIEVDDRLRTTNPNVFALGDVASRYQFTHVADFMARMAVRNALFFGRDKFSSLLVPWATYTDPEVAHVGLYEHDLESRGIGHRVFRRDFAEVDRTLLEGETEGFVKILVRKGSDEILGATIVGPHAGDLISEVSVAMQAGMGLGALANVIHPYPTAAEAIRQCGDAYNRTRLTPTVKRIFNRLMAIQR